MKKYLILFALILMIGCGNQKPKTYHDTIEIPSLGFHEVTSQGIRVDSPVNVPVHSLNAIDKGIGQMIDASTLKYPNWIKKRTFPEFHVIFINPTGFHSTLPPGGPLITVGAGNHNNAYAATLGVAGDGWTDGQVLIFPHQADSDWAFDDLLTNISRYEAEHDAEWNNDRTVFWYFWNHGDVHPHY